MAAVSPTINLFIYRTSTTDQHRTSKFDSSCSPHLGFGYKNGEEMPIKRLADLCGREAVEFMNHVLKENPLLPFLLPLVVVAWALERWLVRFSNWVPLAVAVRAMIQVCVS